MTVTYILSLYESWWCFHPCTFPSIQSVENLYPVRLMLTNLMRPRHWHWRHDTQILLSLGQLLTVLFFPNIIWDIKEILSLLQSRCVWSWIEPCEGNQAESSHHPPTMRTKSSDAGQNNRVARSTHFRFSNSSCVQGSWRDLVSALIFFTSSSVKIPVAIACSLTRPKTLLMRVARATIPAIPARERDFFGESATAIPRNKTSLFLLRTVALRILPSEIKNWRSPSNLLNQ